MPWKEATVESERERFVQLAILPKANTAALCKEFGISSSTGYDWLGRYKRYGLPGLVSRSKRPANSPNKTTSNIESLILTTRDKRPTWGALKISKHLLDQGYVNLPSEKTIKNILKRNGRICLEESEKHKPFIRFEHESPNMLWQMDFKGHFPVANERCHPLTLLDDHSRFLLELKCCHNEQGSTVKVALIDLFRSFGLPDKMTMDNGSPWGYSGSQLYTTLNAWMMRLGIIVMHSRPRHPQTQGKLERLHRTLNEDVIKRYSFASMEDAQYAFDMWRDDYNYVRPHGAIDLETPSKRYQKSKKMFPENLPAIEYDSNLEVRKVQQKGIIFYKGNQYRVGDAFRGHHVGLKESKEDGLMDVYFCHQRVFLLDLRNGAI